MSNYHHDCTGCGHEWQDHSRHYHCPWCGEPCTNELSEEDELDEYRCSVVIKVGKGKSRQCKRLPLFDGMCEQHAKMKGKI